MSANFGDVIAAIESVCGPELVSARRGAWCHFPCCECNDHKGRFGVNVETMWCHCFKCGLSMGAYKLLSKSGVRIKKGKARKRIRRETKKPIPSEIPGYVPWWDITNRGILSLCTAYFKERHINYKEVEWGISTESRYAYRIMLPVRFRGEVVTFQARSYVSRCEVKTVSASSDDGWVKTSDALYGYDRQRTGEKLVVCEGPADAIRTGGVALFGSLVSKSQLMILSSLNPSEVVLFLDSDAKEKAKNMAQKIYGVSDTLSVVTYKEGEVADPCSVEDPATKIEEAKKFRSKTGLFRWIVKG